MPGLVAAKIGAQRVILCDDPKVELWTQLVRQTVTANSMIADRLSVDVLDWYDESTIALLIEKYFPHQVDLIFGSDIFFQKRGLSIRRGIEFGSSSIFFLSQY